MGVMDSQPMSLCHSLIGCVGNISEKDNISLRSRKLIWVLSRTGFPRFVYRKMIQCVKLNYINCIFIHSNVIKSGLTWKIHDMCSLYM